MITATATAIHRSALARLVLGTACVVLGAAGPLQGCKSIGASDVALYMSTADRVVRAVAKASESAKVTAARERCNTIEAAAAAAEDASTAAALLRELAAAQKDLADAIEADAAR